MITGGEDEAAVDIRTEYLLALLRSRRAVTRILESLSRWAEHDAQVARALAERPEALTALLQTIHASEKAAKESRPRKQRRRGKPAPPLFPGKASKLTCI